MPIFSVIIPTFNADNKINSTLSSICRQNQDLYEVIVMDGGSTDTTLDIVNGFAVKHPGKIHCISEPDKNVFEAMNKGILQATGGYLYFLGAGDILRENVLESVSRHLSHLPEIVYGDVYLTESDTVYGFEFTKKEISYFNLCHQAVFYNREVFDIVGKYEPQYVPLSDMVLNIRIFGRQDIAKKYIKTVVADYEGNGISDWMKNKRYIDDMPDIIKECLGDTCYDIYMRSGRMFFDYLRHAEDEKIAIFGEEREARETYRYIRNSGNKSGSNLKLVSYLLEDPSTWTGQSDGATVNALDKSVLREVDSIIIAAPWTGKQNPVVKLLKGSKSEKKIIPGIVYSKSFMDFLDSTDSAELIVFGAGERGKAVEEYIDGINVKYGKNLNIKYFFDNNHKKWGSKLCRKEVLKPQKERIKEKDIIVIASMRCQEIKSQLRRIGAASEQLICCSGL